MSGHTLVQEKRRFPSLWLSDTSFKAVSLSGISELQRLLGEPEASPKLLEFAKRKNGSFLVLRPTVFRQLLTRGYDLKAIMPNDVVSVQMDVKHLTLCQLLFLAHHYLDFDSNDRHFESHRCFMEMIRKMLHQKLGQWLVDLAGKKEELSSLNPVTLSKLMARRNVLLQELGRALVMVVGCNLLFDKRLASRGAPRCWALPHVDEELLSVLPLRPLILIEAERLSAFYEWPEQQATVYCYRDLSPSPSRLEWQVIRCTAEEGLDDLDVTALKAEYEQELHQVIASYASRPKLRPTPDTTPELPESPQKERKLIAPCLERI